MSRKTFRRVQGLLSGVVADFSVRERLEALSGINAGEIVFTTSFGLEDQVITHFIAGAGLDIRIATLDTGRLFPETYKVWAETEARYGVKIAAFYPERAAMETLVQAQGIDGFYHSVEARKACCGVRKVEPLGRALMGRALAGADVWVTGIRADQSQNRGGAAFIEYDEARAVVKFNPLLDWSREKAAAFAAEQAIPVNALHAKGFLSIGCAPCTRALQPGEPERAGRWWWEDDAKKECGLHVGADGRLVRGPQPEAVA